MSSQAQRLKDVSREEAQLYDDVYLRVEHQNYFVACNGKQVRLARKEFLILSYLAQNAERAVPAKEIWSHIWGGTTRFSLNTLKVNIHRVRRQLEPFDVHIKNRPNHGYRLLCGPGGGSLPE